MKHLIDKAPKSFTLENVKGFGTGRQSKSTPLDLLLGILRDITNKSGQPLYHVEHKVLDSQDFGLAHHRERVWIIGLRRDCLHHRFSWPQDLWLRVSKWERE